MADKERAYEPKKRSLASAFDVGDAELLVRHWPGSGPKVLLAHGWMDCSASFQFLVDALEGDRDVWSFDWRGMGLSGWQSGGYYDRAVMMLDLKRLMDGLFGDEPVHALGHSLGGMILTQFFPMFPEKFRSLVLAEGMGIVDGDLDKSVERLREHVLRADAPEPFSIYDSLREYARKLGRKNPGLDGPRSLFLARELMREIPGGDDDAEAALKVFRSPRARLEEDPWTEDVPVTQRADPAHRVSQPIPYRWEWVRRFAKEIAVPVLCLEGGSHPKNVYIRRLKDEIGVRYGAFQKVEVVALEKSGHMMQWDDPEGMARAVEKYWLKMADAAVVAR